MIDPVDPKCKTVPKLGPMHKISPNPVPFVLPPQETVRGRAWTESTRRYSVGMFLWAGGMLLACIGAWWTARQGHVPAGFILQSILLAGLALLVFAFAVAFFFFQRPLTVDGASGAVTCRMSIGPVAWDSWDASSDEHVALWMPARLSTVLGYRWRGWVLIVGKVGMNGNQNWFVLASAESREGLGRVLSTSGWPGEVRTESTELIAGGVIPPKSRTRRKRDS